MLAAVLRSFRRETFTSLLDVAGLGLLVAAAAVCLGVAAALAAGGLAVLAVSWSLSRTQR